MMETVQKLFLIFNRKQKAQFIVSFILQLIGTVFDLFGISMLVPVIMALVEPDTLIENDLVQSVMEFLHLETTKELILFTLVLLGTVFVVKNVYFIIMTYVQYQILWHNELKTEIRTMQIYIHRPYSYHTQKNSAEIQRTILTDIGNAFSAVESVFSLVADVIAGVMITIFLFINNWSITVGLIIVLAVFLLLYLKVFKKRLYLYGKLGQRYGADSVKCIHQAFGGIKEVKIYQCEEYLVDAYKEKRAKQISMLKRGMFSQVLPRYCLEPICIIGVLSPIFIMALMDIELKGIVAQMAIFAGASYKLMPIVIRLNSRLSNLINYKASVDLIYEVMQDTGIGEKSIEEQKDEIEIQDNADIWLEKVSFEYEKGNAILKDVDLRIKPGTSVAFVGLSGAGKTTLADIILGILQPSTGKVYYGTEELKDLSGEWQRKVGYIPQNIFLTDDTIRNNVAFGKREIDDQKVWKALKEAQLETFVREKEAGLDLTIGEAGVRMSGGQRQRLGIARALYNDPQILILDEATSALDNETEKAIMESIDYLRGKKTLIIIAHRMTTIEKCDIVYEVKKGKVVRQT